MVRIYSKHHFVVSVAVGAVFLAVGPSLPVAPPVAVAYAGLVGVGIDLDHFLIARLTTGEWQAVRRAVTDPRTALLDQGDLFDPDALTELQRLLTHVVVVGVAVPATWLVSDSLALLTAVVLYVHVLTDLLWDVFATPPDRS